MKFPPSIWGPFFWHTIHIVALGYPKNPSYADKKSAKEFYEAFAFLLPCSVCKEHYKAHLQAHPITPYLDSRTDLLKWTIEIHNEVNKMLGKPTWSMEEIIAYYNRLGQRDRSPIWTKEDMNEVDYRSFVRGFITSTTLFGLVGGAYYMAYLRS